MVIAREFRLYMDFDILKMDPSKYQSPYRAWILGLQWSHDQLLEMIVCTFPTRWYVLFWQYVPVQFKIYVYPPVNISFTYPAICPGTVQWVYTYPAIYPGTVHVCIQCGWNAISRCILTRVFITRNLLRNKF